jgi:hypothetical protein
MIWRWQQLVEYLKAHPGSYLEQTPSQGRKLPCRWQVCWQGSAERVYPLAVQAALHNGEIAKAEDGKDGLPTYRLPENKM